MSWCWAIYYMLFQWKITYISTWIVIGETGANWDILLRSRAILYLCVYYWIDVMMLSYLIHAFWRKRTHISTWIVIVETGANWDTFIIYCPGADNNRVRDSKQAFNLGVIFVVVTRAFNKWQLKPIQIWWIKKKKLCPSLPRIRTLLKFQQFRIYRD